MNKKIIIITTILAFCLNLEIKAEKDLDYINGSSVLTPNAHDFSRFGNIPMNYYTGHADVSIPIYNTTQKGVPLDISFKYDTGGLKLNQLPTWTGHGWSLNVGGIITRIKHMIPDEYTQKLDGAYKLQGYFYNTDFISETINKYGYSDKGYNEFLARELDLTTCIVNDLYPDEFAFNFMGYSGRFFLDQSNNWCVQSDQNIRVELDVHNPDNYISPFIDEYPYYGLKGTPKSLKGFTLIDENGTRYVFGGTTDAIDYTFYCVECPCVIEPWVAESWYLTKVLDRHGNTLYDLTYERGKFALQITNNTWQNKLYVYKSEQGVSFQGPAITESNYTYPALADSWMLTAPVYLSNIHTYDNHDIKFDLSKTISLKASTDFYKTLIDNVLDSEKLTKRIGYFPYTSARIQGENGIWREPTYEEYSSGRAYWGTFVHTEWCAFSRCAYYKKYYDFNTRNGIEPYEARDFYFYIRRIEPNYTGDYDAPTEPYYTKYWCDSTAKKRAWDLSHRTPKVEDYMNPIDAIEFIPLENITITDPSGKKIRYTLTYDKKPRLHLTDISMYSYSNDEFVKEQNYHFNYQDYDKLDNDYTTRQTDYWGYYNGAIYKIAPVNISNVIGIEASLDRDPDKSAHPDLAQYGMLKEIIYPTGGKSVFEYEGNNYSQQLTYTRQTLNKFNENKITGGLRIKKISEYDSEGGLLKSKTYDYTLENGLSSGQSFTEPIQEYQYYLYKGNNHSGRYRYRREGVIPITNSFGLHIGYSRVVESLQDGSKIIRKFTNFGDYKDELPIKNWMTDSITEYDNFSERGYMCGKLLSEEVYDKDNVLLSSTKNTYAIDDPNKYIIVFNGWPQTLAETKTDYGCMEHHYTVGNVYKYYYSKLNLVSTITTIKQDNGYVTDSVKYVLKDIINKPNGATPANNITKCVMKTVYRKTGNAVTDSIRTNYEYPKLVCFNNQYFFPVIGEMNYHNNYFMGGKKTEYNKDNEENSLFNLNLLVPTKEMVFTPIGKNDKDSITTITYNSFDTDGNVETYTEPGKCMTKLFYETIAGAKRLVARVTCASGYYGITCNPVAADPRYIIQKNGVSIFNIPETEAIVYSYDTAGRVSSITSGSGQSLYYVYDNVMRLSIIKDQNGKIVKRYTYNYKNK